MSGVNIPKIIVFALLLLAILLVTVGTGFVRVLGAVLVLLFIGAFLGLASKATRPGKPKPAASENENRIDA